MAVLIMLQAIMRLFSADNFRTFTGFALTLYLIIFSIALCCIECNLKRARVWFYFMNYSLGKFFFYVVMAALCFGSGAQAQFFDILVGIIFALCAVMYFTFHFWFKTEEPEFVQRLIEQMNEKQAAADAAK